MHETKSIRLSGLEALRGFAACAVVLFHVARHVNKNYGAPQLRAMFESGHAGVDLFFVISGFIILFVHWPDVGRPARLWHYAGRRFTRIMPLYWFGLAVTVIMSAAGHDGMPGLDTVAMSASLLPSVQEPLINIAWTLQYEVVFYVMFAALVASRTAGAGLLAVWFGVIVAVAVVGRPIAVPQALCGAFALEFFFGMAMAALLRLGSIRAPRTVAGFGAALFTAILVTESAGLFNGFGVWARVLYGISAAVLVVGVAAAELSGRPVRLPGLGRLGGASYSIYLFQFIFIGVVWKALEVTGLAAHLPSLAVFVLLAGASIGGGLLVHRLAEQPLLRLFRGRRVSLRAV